MVTLNRVFTTIRETFPVGSARISPLSEGSPGPTAGSSDAVQVR
jgi:hypothetical protein